MISFVVLIISAFLNWNIVSLTTSVLEILFITLLIRLLNNYRIDFGDSEYEKYEEYCIKLFGFLKHFKVKEDNLSEIHENICKKIDCLKLEEEKAI